MHNTLNNSPRWLLMWLLAGGLFMLGKAAVLFRMKITGTPWPMWKTLAWFCAWPGMHARDFDGCGQKCSLSPGIAIVKITAGGILLWGAARHFDNPLAAGWCGMIGLILAACRTLPKHGVDATGSNGSTIRQHRPRHTFASAA